MSWRCARGEQKTEGFYRVLQFVQFASRPRPMRTVQVGLDYGPMKIPRRVSRRVSRFRTPALRTVRFANSGFQAFDPGLTEMVLCRSLYHCNCAKSRF